MDANRPVSYDLADYLGMLRRHWWAVLLLTVAGVGGAAAFGHHQPRVYESATSVLVIPTGGQDTNAAGGRTSAMINLDTEAQIVVSTDIATAAQKLLKVATPPDRLAANVAVTVPPNTTVLTITYSAGSPQEAQSGSHAFAIEYLQIRQSTAQTDLTTQISALDAKVKQYSAALSQLSGQLARLPTGDPNKADLNSQINTLTNQINTLTSKENALATTQVTAGKVISDAQLPARPSRPSIPMFLASGALLGLLLGLGTALTRERTDKRVRRAADVSRRDDVPVLATLPTSSRPRLDDVFPPFGMAGRTFHRLRNEVLASLAESGPVSGARVIVVTGASRGFAAAIVATNLAAALARAGAEVVLVCAQVSEDRAEVSPATRMLGVAAVPGLSDVLAGRMPLNQATQRARHYPSLRVLPAGGNASAGGPPSQSPALQSPALQSPALQSPALRELLVRLRAEGEYVVIEAPSAAASADAQSLASQADAAIVAIELRRTHHLEVVDAAEQLRGVGTPLLGGVVFPRLRRASAPPPIAPPVAPPVSRSSQTVEMEMPPWLRRRGAVRPPLKDAGG